MYLFNSNLSNLLHLLYRNRFYYMESIALRTNIESLSGLYCLLELNIFYVIVASNNFFLNMDQIWPYQWYIPSESFYKRERILCRKIETVLAHYKYRRQKIRKRTYHSLASLYQQGYLECASVMVLPYYYTVIKYTRHFLSSLHLHNNR